MRISDWSSDVCSSDLPMDRMLEGEREKLLHMEEALGKRVIGQDHAVKAVSTAVRRARAGLQDPNRPLGRFLFLGPTGVGKTELTQSLAPFLLEDRQRVVQGKSVSVRADMVGCCILTNKTTSIKA